MATERAERILAAWLSEGQTEEAVYRPALDGLDARTITVVVHREAVEPLGHGRAMRFRVTAINDAELGIPADPSLSDVGADRIDVAERLGGTAVSRGFQRFVNQDEDFVVVEVT